MVSAGDDPEGAKASRKAEPPAEQHPEPDWTEVHKHHDELSPQRHVFCPVCQGGK